MPNNLSRALNDLGKHHSNRAEMMEKCVQERLSQSIETYYKELTQSLEFLASRNGLRVIKKLNKELK